MEVSLTISVIRLILIPILPIALATVVFLATAVILRIPTHQIIPQMALFTTIARILP